MFVDPPREDSVVSPFLVPRIFTVVPLILENWCTPAVSTSGFIKAGIRKEPVSSGPIHSNNKIRQLLNV